MSIKQAAQAILAKMAEEAGPDDYDGFELLTLIKLVGQLQEPPTVRPAPDLPEPGQIVILWRKYHSSGKVSWVKAQYARFRELTADPEYWGDEVEYDEEKDEYYCAEGWYEFSHSNDDCESWLIHDSEFELLGWLPVEPPQFTEQGS